MRIGTAWHVICLLIRIESVTFPTVTTVGLEEKIAVLFTICPKLNRRSRNRRGGLSNKKYTDMPILKNVLEKKVGLTRESD